MRSDVDLAIQKRIKKVTDDISKNQDIPQTLQNQVKGLISQVNAITPDPTAAFIKSLTPLSQSDSAKLAEGYEKLPEDSSQGDGLALFALMGDPHFTALGMQTQILNYLEYERDRTEKIRMQETETGFKPVVEEDAQTGKTKIKTPASVIADQASALPEHATLWALEAHMEPEEEVAKETTDGSTQQTLSNYAQSSGQQQQQPQNPTNNTNGRGGGTDWLRLLQIGLTAYCTIDPGSSVCGGGDEEEPEPEPEPVVPPSLSILTGTSTLGSMLESGVAWNSTGVTACTFTTDWKSFGDGTSAVTTPATIQAMNTAATPRGTIFVFHPQAFKVTAARVSRATGTARTVQDQLRAFRTEVERIYPAPNYPEKTVILERTAYTPLIPTTISEGDTMTLTVDGQTISVPLVTGDTAQSIASKLSVLASQLPADNPLQQTRTAKHMQWSALDGQLVITGDVLVNDPVPASASYGLSCTGADGTIVQKSVSIPFGSATITR